MNYQFLDIVNNSYELNGASTSSVVRNTLARGSENYTFDQKTVDRSFLNGSTKIGSPRLQSRKFVLSSDFAFTNDLDYDNYINELLYWLDKVEIIQDLTNDKQAYIAPVGLEASFERGTIKRSGNIMIKMNLLEGYWEDILEISETVELPVGSTEFPIDNQGWLETYPTFILTVEQVCNQVDLYVQESKEGIQIKDSSFGIPSMEDLTINCKKGTTIIGDFDRSKSITQRTGYFPIPVGPSTLIVEVPVACTFTAKYRRRYYS